MATISTKFRVGAAAVVLAGAAVLPTHAAQADIAGQAPLAPVTQVLERGALGTGTFLAEQTIFQNDWFWFGSPNSNPPARQPILSFQPLNLLPGFIRPFFGWFAALNLEACFLGVSAKIGPYGTVSVSIGRGC